MSYNLTQVSQFSPNAESDIIGEGKLGLNIFLNVSYGNSGGQSVNNNGYFIPIVSPSFTSDRLAYTSSNVTYLNANQSPVLSAMGAPYRQNWMDKVQLTGTNKFLVFWQVPTQEYYNHTADAQIVDANNTSTVLSTKVACYSGALKETRSLLIVSVIQAPVTIAVLISNSSNYGTESMNSMFSNFVYVEEII